MPDRSLYKRCTACGEEKHLFAFYLNYDKRSGQYYPRGRCRQCELEHQANRRSGPTGEQVRAAERQRWRRDVEGNRRKSREKHWRNRAKELAQRRTPEARDRRDELERARLFDFDIDTVAYVNILRRDPCAYCGAPMEEIDHITPVSRNGANSWDNLTASCLECNRSKHARLMLVFLADRKVASCQM